MGMRVSILMATVPMSVVVSLSLPKVERILPKGLFGARGVKEKTYTAEEVVKFGVISDVQFANIADGTNYDKTKMRRYRQSLETLVLAGDKFQAETKFAVALGDIFDSKATKERDEALRLVQKAMGTFEWHTPFGNHDLHCFSRQELRTMSANFAKQTDWRDTAEDGLYYDFTPADGVRCIVVDAYYVSVVGAAGGDEGHRKSAEYLASKNHNIDARDPARPSSETRAGWLHGIDPESDDVRFVPFNGGLGPNQLEWLGRKLADADAKNELVFLFSHLPFYRRASKRNNVGWDFPEVLDALDRFPNLRLVVFAGHDHDGGYARRVPSSRHRPQHHITPSAPLECAQGQRSFGIVTVFDHHVHIDWTGKTPPNPHDDWPSLLSFDRQYRRLRGRGRLPGGWSSDSSSSGSWHQKARSWKWK